MLLYVRGDIFATPQITHIVHGVNLKGAFGAGIAGEIAKKYPEARADYRNALDSGKLTALGHFHETKLKNGLRIIHAATQENPGADARLEAVNDAISCVRAVYGWRRNAVIAVPQIGCGIGGLAWADVKKIMEEYLGNTRALFLVFQYFVQGQPAQARTHGVIPYPTPNDKNTMHQWQSRSLRGASFPVAPLAICLRCGLFRMRTTEQEYTNNYATLNKQSGNYSVNLYSYDRSNWSQDLPKCVDVRSSVELLEDSAEMIERMALSHKSPYTCTVCEKEGGGHEEGCEVKEHLSKIKQTLTVGKLIPKKSERK